MRNDSIPMISVIVPVYNAETSLRSCIDSILNQSFSDLELILVDDGSTDTTGAICDEFAQQDDRVRVIHQKNGGVSCARNTGLHAAKGRWIAWLDSDDSLERSMLEVLWKTATKHGKQIAICNYRNIRKDGTAITRYGEIQNIHTYNRNQLVGLILCRVLMTTLWGNIVERELYQDILFPEGRIYEDVSVFYRICERSDGAVFVPEVLHNRNLSETSLSNTNSLEKGLQCCEAYIHRYQDAINRWPQYNLQMLSVSLRLCMKRLLVIVLETSWKDYCRQRKRIKRVCGFFRKHRLELVPRELLHKPPDMFFIFLTSGFRSGFILAKIVNKLLPQRYKDMKFLGMPELPEM